MGELAAFPRTTDTRQFHTVCAECSIRVNFEQQLAEDVWQPRPELYNVLCPTCFDADLAARKDAADLARFEKAVREVLPPKYAVCDSSALIPALQKWDGARSLFLTGGVGTGKTHQASAFVHAHWRRLSADGVPSVSWQKVPRFLEAVRRSFSDESSGVPDVVTPQLLVLDDLGSEKPSEWVAERLFTIIDDRYERGRPILVTSNLSMVEIGERIGERTASRLREMCGKAVGIGGADRRRSA